MTPADERILIHQARQGNMEAFGALVQCHQKAVFNVAYRLLGRRRDAEDATQEVFIRAFYALDRFDLERPFAPWIKRITVNLCLNWLSSARTRTSVLAADLGQRDGERIELDSWQNNTPTPEQAVITAEQKDAIREAIWQLPPMYRAVIELRHFQNLSYAEIADVLERPLSSVKSDLFRARKMLAEKLKATMQTG
ncbi:MAG: sigma-70 family RNA polymerase sigma factor [Chloroflexi bacterium]|nr:MAG: sigma-70 family RNA polymerase sigma factor [Chloroflexota bacterium]